MEPRSQRLHPGGSVGPAWALRAQLGDQTHTPIPCRDPREWGAERAAEELAHSPSLALRWSQYGPASPNGILRPADNGDSRGGWGQQGHSPRAAVPKARELWSTQGWPWGAEPMGRGQRGTQRGGMAQISSGARQGDKRQPHGCKKGPEPLAAPVPSPQPPSRPVPAAVPHPGALEACGGCSKHSS